MKNLDNRPRIYLSYSARDETVAARVTRTLSEGGCDIVLASNIESGSSWSNRFKAAMQDTDAMVLIASDTMIASPNTAFEFGAAMAWGKPVYTVGSARSVPVYLRQTRIVPLSRLRELPRELQKEAQPMTDEERRILLEVYLDLGVSTDKLFLEPEASEQLVVDFNRRARGNAGLNRLVRELLRLRTLGLLPKLGRPSTLKRNLPQTVSTSRRSA